MIPFAVLEKFFETHVPLDQAVKLGPGEMIIDPAKFIETHIAVLKNNPGNRRVMPFYIRLVKYYNIVKK